VVQEPTTTTVSSNINPAAYGQTVNLTAEVDADGYTPTGNVTFMDGNTVLGTATLSLVNAFDVATLAVSGLAVGNHNITAIYPGATSFAGSTSAPYTQVIVQTTSSARTTPNATLTSSAPTATWGQAGTFTVVLGPVGPFLPTGMVTFWEGALLLGSVSLQIVNGQAVATFTTTALPVGSFLVTALYSGDANFNSAAATFQQVVTPPG
jgi:hypothetical protein